MPAPPVSSRELYGCVQGGPEMVRPFLPGAWRSGPRGAGGVGMAEERTATTTRRGRYCGHCGQPLSATAIFCGNCGTRAPAPLPVSAGGAQTAAQPAAGYATVTLGQMLEHYPRKVG